MFPAVTIERGTLREEPFRLFFPLAVLATLGGATLWPLLHHGLLQVYPNVMHARVMTVAFAGFFVGFLGTAFPRLIEAPPLRGLTIALLLGLWLASLGFYFTNRIATGDGLFSMMLLLFALNLVTDWIRGGRDTPPPGMPVALVGLLGGGLACGALAWQRGQWLDPFDHQLAQLQLYQGMALLCLLGVGPYLLPRLFGHQSAHRFDASPSPPRGWWPRFAVCAALGLAVQGSFVLEAGGAPGWGMSLRGVVVLAWILGETPLLRRARSLTTCGTATRVALLTVVSALVWSAMDPARRISILHLFFFSGLGLVILAIGVRVVLGHAGRHDLLAGKIVWLRVVIGLALLGATTRVSADFLPRIRVSHLDYAAATWVVLAVLWLWKLRGWFFAQESGENPGKCPKTRGRTLESTAPSLPERGDG